MDFDLRSVVYCSISELRGTDEQITAELHRILRKSRVRNARLGVTGSLLYSRDGHFAQALEGPAEAVGTILAAIQIDKRNRLVTIGLDRHVTKREFGAWSMAFGGPGHHPQVSKAIEAVFAGSANAGEKMRQVLKSVIVREEQ